MVTMIEEKLENKLQCGNDKSATSEQQICDFIVEESFVGERLDNFICTKLQDKTRSQIKVLIENGKALLNGKQKKAGEKLRLADKVSVTLEAPKEVLIEKQNIALEIVYQDADLAVINKPQGMVVHPATGNYSGTLVNALLYNISDLSGINGELRPGIVHRLDKNTAGLLIVAKNDKSHLNLQSQIQSKTCKRFYKALVIGNVKDDEGVIQTYIGRSCKDRKKMSVTDEKSGRIAITHYRVLERFNGYTFMQFELKTGRTHQIRVHCAEVLKTPIVGDFDYAERQKNIFHLSGQLLCAYRIEFTQPTSGERLQFEIDLPNYFKTTLNTLRKKL